ncbi:MAG: MBL fold metallo-hydrolase [Actinobacteria bacterium]|nr:MBL fold metallo-hydrolase [Actinomycetota bacterium]
MNVVALGTSGTYPRFQRACSGLLFADDPTFVLVDIGTGVMANLFRYVDPFNLSAIILTHLHADHVLDIYPLRYYLQYNNTSAKRRIPIYAGDDALSVLHGFNPGGDDGNFLEKVFEFKTIQSNKEETNDEKCLIIGSLRFYFAETKHIVSTYALRCETKEGKKVGYTSDTSFSEDLVKFFKDVDVLICEAAYQGENGKENLHMSAREAGRFASMANAKKLFLTHIWPELDPTVSKVEAEEEFGDEVIILKEHMIIEI